MKENDDPGAGNGGRVRFQKQKWPMDMTWEDPYGCIAHVFIWLHPEDFHNELQEWLRVALISEQGAYDEGSAREDVMDFCNELQKLVMAMDKINKSRKATNLPRKMDDPAKDLQEAMKSYDQPVLSKEEKNPAQMINKFCTMFTLSYARRELWDLLDSVIFYEKKEREWGPDPLTTYRCLSALVEAAFIMMYQIFL